MKLYNKTSIAALFHRKSRSVPSYGKRSLAKRPPAFLEPLEPRILLSADITPVADALADGLHLFGDRLEHFFDGESLLDTRLPFIVQAQRDGESTENVAPTISSLFSIPVDLNGDSTIAGSGNEYNLDQLDNAGTDDDMVDLGEFLQGWFFQEIQDYLGDSPPGTTTTDFVDFLENDLDKTWTVQIAGNNSTTTITFDVLSAIDLTETGSPIAEQVFDVDFSLTVSQDLAIDLGTEADALKLLYYTGTYENRTSPEIPVETAMEFGFTFGVRTGGQESPGEVLDEGDFFIRTADDLNLSVTSEVQNADNFDFWLNIGFLGAKVENAEITYDAAVKTLLIDPDSPEVLGFTTDQYGVEQTGGVVTGSEVIEAVDLAHDAGFVLRIGNSGIATEVKVMADDNDNFNDLLDDVNAALVAAGLGDLIEASLTGTDPDYMLQFQLVPTTGTPLGFADESYSATGELTADPDSGLAYKFEYAEDISFLLSVDGALPKLVTVVFPDPAKTDLKFGNTQTAVLPDELVGQFDAHPSGRIFGDTDAEFDVRVTQSDGTITEATVTVTEDLWSPDPNTSLTELNYDLIFALANAGLNSLILSKVEGDKLALYAWDSSKNVSAIEITAIDAETSAYLGFTAGQKITLELEANSTLEDFDLSGDAHFKLNITLDTDPGTPITETVTVMDHDRLNSNDLKNDINSAIDTALGSDKIDVEVVGNKIVLKAKDNTVLAFDIVTVNENIDDLVADVNRALDAAGLGSLVDADAVDIDTLQLATTGDETLEITKTLTFDAGDTYAELQTPADNPTEGTATEDLFAPEVDDASNITFDMPVSILPGLNYTPSGVAMVGNFSPFGRLPIEPPIVDPPEDAVAQIGISDDRFDLKFTLTPEINDQDTPVGSVPDSSTLTEEIRLVNMAEPLNFNLVTAENMIGLLTGLGTALQEIANSGLFAAYDIPFAEASLADLLNFADPDFIAYAGLIDRSLIYDTDGDGVYDPSDVESLNNDENKLLKWKNVDGEVYLIPSFVTAQDMADTLSAILGVALTGTGGINANYDPDPTVSDPSDPTKGINELTYEIELVSSGRTNISIDDAPFQYDVDLSPFAKLTLDTTTAPDAGQVVALQGYTGLTMTFGIDLSPPGYIIAGDTNLADLNGGDGIDIKTERAVTGELGVRTLYALSRNATFDLIIDGGDPIPVEVNAEATWSNESIGALIGDIQYALNEALLDAGYSSGDVTAGFDADNPTRLKLYSPGVGTIQLVAAANDPTVLELGFAGNRPAAQTITAFRAPTVYVGRLTGDASFTIDIVGDGEGPYLVTVLASQTNPDEDMPFSAGNRTIADLVEDVNNALAAAGLNTDPDAVGGIRADYDNISGSMRLVITATDDTTEFNVTPSLDVPSIFELGLPYNGGSGADANQYDFIVYDRSGGSHGIALDGVGPAVQDLIDLINAQTDGDIEAGLNPTHTGLQLLDTSGSTLHDRPWVKTVNGSGALLTLGLFNADNTGDGFDLDEGVLVGGPIGETHLDDRFFVRDAELWGALGLQTPESDLAYPDGGNPASGLFGIVGVDTRLFGEMYAEFTAAIKDPDTGAAGGTATLLELFEGAKQGRLTDDASFTIDIADDGEPAYTITIYKSDTLENNSLQDLVTLINDALITELSGTDYEGKIVAQASGTRIVFAAVDDTVPAFTINASGTAITELGLPDANTSSTLNEDGIQTFMARSASRYAVGEVEVTEAYELAIGGVFLGAFTPGDMVYGWDWVDTNPNGIADPGDTYNRTGEALILSDEPGLLTLGHVRGTFASADYLTDAVSDIFTSTIRAYGTYSEAVQKDSFGEFRLHVDVQDGFDDIGFVVGDTEHGFGLLDGQSYDVYFAITGFGNPYDTTAPADNIDDIAGVKATAAFDDLAGDTGDLYAFRDLDYGDLNLAIKGSVDPEIQGLLGILQDVEDSFTLLNTVIPAIGMTVSDLLNLVDGFEQGANNLDNIFAEAILALETDVDYPLLTLQDIPNAIRGAFGLPEGVDPADPDAVDWVSFDFDKAGNMLLVDMSLNETISTKLGLNIDGLEDEEHNPLPNLTSGGVLKAEGTLDVNLRFGIDLAAPNEAYLFDDSSIAVDLHVEGEGQEYAGGEDGLGMIFWASLGPLSVFIQDADALIDLSFSLPGLDFSGEIVPGQKPISDVEFGDWLEPVISADEVDIVLPMFFGGEGPGDYLDDFEAFGTFAGGLTVNVPQFQGILDDIELGLIDYDPFDNIFLGFDTLNLYLEGLSDILADEVLGLRMPFIGDQMADILFIETFRPTLYSTLKNGVANAINPDPDTIVQGLLATALGDYLVGGIDGITYNSNKTGDVLGWYREWSFSLAGDKTIVLSDFDLGIPNLNFDLDTPVQVDLHWEIDLGFGVNFVESAYIDVSSGKELDLDLTISLPEDNVVGMLGFLLVDVTGTGDTGAVLNFDVDVKNGETTLDHLGFSDLGSINPEAVVAGSALGSATDGDGDGDPDILTLHMVTEAIWGLPELHADLILDWSLPGGTDVESLEGNAVTPPDVLGIGVEYIALLNMEFDTGSIARSLIEPLFGEIIDKIEPFMPVIDVITAPIPVLSDLAGEPFTILDLAAIFGEVDPDFIDAVADILDVISIIGDAMATNVLPLGDLVLFDSTAGIINFDPFDPDSELHEIDLTQLTQESDTDGLTVPRGGAGDADTFDYTPDSNKFLKLVREQEVEGLSMPIFTDPLQGIGLFLNQNAIMVDYELPPLGVEFEYLQVFPIWGPLAVSIEISFGFTVDLHSVGFDTYGYQRYADGGFRNPAVMFDGFYLNDLDEEGVDAPEVLFEFGLVGAAELNLGIARAGVGGGINATIFFDWHDPIADGRVHISEMYGNIVSADPGPNPFAVFDLGGALTFQLFAFLEISLFGIEEEFPITPETELFSFEYQFDHDPILANKIETPDGNILQLNMGPNSEDRIYGNTSDGHESITVEYEGGAVKVYSSAFGVSKGSLVNTFYDIDHIVGIGDQGNDEINLILGDSGITYELEGGVGDDRLTVSGGAGGSIRGGVGNDTLTGGAGNDIIYGEEGNDTIDGGAGHDILFGDFGRVFDPVSDPDPLVTSRITGSDGDDTIHGGEGHDVIIGAGGDDTLYGDAGNDVIIGDGGRFAYVGDYFDITAVPGFSDVYPYVPELVDTDNPTDPDVISEDIDKIHDAVVAVIHATDLGFGGNDKIYGGENDDIMFGGTGDDEMYGDAGNDIILGGKGFDDIHGGTENDTIFGNDQADTIAGDAGNDVISGGSGNDYIHGNTGNDVMKGDSGGDVMFGDAGNDQVFGQTEPDILFGGAGDDLVVGGTSNDIMFGDDGVVAKLDPGTGYGSKVIYNDTLISGLVVEALIGSVNSQEGDSWWDDDIRSLDLIQTYVTSNDGDDFLSGNAGDDFMFGGGGNDTMGGDVDPRLPSFDRPTEISEDVMIGDGGRITFDQRRFRSIATVIGDSTGSPFNDTIYGDNGNDYILGGRGDDILAGGHGPDRGATDSVASDNDIIIGDNGELIFADDTITANFGRLELIRTTDVLNTTGGADTAYGEEGSDVILGGVNNDDGIDEPEVDRLYGDYYDYDALPVPAITLGNDIILGDNGVLYFALGSDTDLDTLDLIRSLPYAVDWSTDPATVDDTTILGGTDIIHGSFGYDVLIGGVAGDEMYGDDETASNGADDGEDIMAGDNADIFFIGTEGRLLVQVAEMDGVSAVDLITTTDTEDETGGADTMSGNAKADVMLGGVNNGGEDTMYGDRGGDDPEDQPTSASIANDRDDIMLGDNGLLDFSYLTNTDRNTLDLIHSEEDGLGGVDVISGNRGMDVAIGGTDGDIIYGDDANASAADDDLGDLLIGDNADVFLVAPLGLGTGFDLKLVLDTAVYLIRTTDEEHPEYGGSDTISGNADNDIIAGGVDGDTIYGDRANEESTQIYDGDDIILGDNGAFEWLSTGRLGEITGIDINANNSALYDWFTVTYPFGDTDLTTLDLVTTEQPTKGGRDLIYGDEGRDLVFGGTDADTIYGDDGIGADLPEGTGTATNNDLLFGDHGRIYPQFSSLRTSMAQDWRLAFNSRNFFAIDVGDAAGGEGDRMWGEEGDDTMVGQQGDDRMWGGSGDDDMTGGHNVAGGYDELSAPDITATLNPPVNDLMDGGSGNDSMAGDNAIIWRRGDDVSPRFRQLTEESMYSTGPDFIDQTITTNVDGSAQSDPDDAIGRDIQLVDHSDVVEATPLGRFGDDVMAGGAGSDVMFGQLGNDLMQGDGNIGADDGDADFLTYAIDVDDTGVPPLDPDNTSETLYFNIPEMPSDGDDYMEGNGGSDLMFGGLGQDDMIGGSSELFGLDDDNAALLGLDAEELRPDGSDIIFGGAGAPVRLMRNDFVGASDTDEGTAEGVGAVPTADDPSIDLADRHARDADFIMGDNANVYRLVVGGDVYPAGMEYDGSELAADSFLTFLFDNYSTLRIIPRAMEQLDYTLGGSDYAGGTYTTDGQATPPGGPADNGMGDLIHGESGDDIIFGMTGSDVIFGESDDDDIIGGYGNDWISGGTGQDGILGDDGLVLTSRNSTDGEPLYGIAGLLAKDASPKYNNGNALNETIATPGNMQYAVINIEGQLKKTVDLVPFSFDPGWMGTDDEFPDDEPPFDNLTTPYADDIIFGGLDNDWLHGGSGDDAISGAEALEQAYVPISFDGEGNPHGVLDLGYNAFGLPTTVFYPGDTVANPNPGNVLAFNPVDLDGRHLNNRFRAGEFYLYDEYDPLRKIELNSNGELWKPGDALPKYEFLLNFDEGEGIYRDGGSVPKATGQQTETYDPANDDGKDAIFGDLGNDWLVGGTGRDNIYGGWGNDLLNADDDLTTLGDAPKHGDPEVEGANDVPDTHPFYEDRVYGGAGRDVLIGNTGGDRLIDWVGEYNSYLVPYAPFGQASVSRTLMPHLQEYLYALSAGDGADPTRYSDAVGGEEPVPTNNNPIPSRNGEPHGELGMVLQKDPAWQDQTGAPADPQAGNIPGGSRDVLRSATFQDETTQGFMAVSGKWSATLGRYYVEPALLGTDSISVWYHDQTLPSYFELRATVRPYKPIAGYKANGYIVFDYYGDDDFKYAGIDSSNNKIVIGQRTAAGWETLSFMNMQMKDGRDYNLMVSVNGTTVILVVNGSQYLTYSFDPRIVDGFELGLNTGMIGLATDSALGSFDNVILQKLPPEETFNIVDDFGGGTDSILQPLTGTWQLDGSGRMLADAAAGTAIALIPVAVSPASYLNYATTVTPNGLAGFVFDFYSKNDFKFAGVNSADNTVVIGHFRNGEWSVDSLAAKTIKSGTAYELGIAITGTQVSVTLNGTTITSHTYNALLNDGAIGLLAKDGSSSFDAMTLWGDDQDFEIFDHTAAEAAALGFNLAEIAGLYNPTFTITWIVDEEEG